MNKVVLPPLPETLACVQNQPASRKEQLRAMEEGRQRNTESGDQQPSDSLYTHPSRRSCPEQIGHDMLVCKEFDGVDEDDIKQHALWILIHLSILSPIIAAIISLYCVLISILILVLFPLTRFITKKSLNTHLNAFLLPPIRFQLDLIYSKYDLGVSGAMSVFRSKVTLVVLSVLAPGYALGLALAAWVAAGFWFFAAILGNPDGKDDRNDGQDSVLGVRVWWERWLMKSLNSA